MYSLYSNTTQYITPLEIPCSFSPEPLYLRNQSPDSAVLHTEFQRHLLNTTSIAKNCKNLIMISHPSNITLTDCAISKYHTCVRSPCKTYTPTETTTRMTTTMMMTTMMTTTTMTMATMRMTMLQGGEGDGARFTVPSAGGGGHLCVGWRCTLAAGGGDYMTNTTTSQKQWQWGATDAIDGDDKTAMTRRR
jgi:hypothetical protein